MTTLGVFRDEFYNAIHILPSSQSSNGPTATGVLPAAQIVGALVTNIAVGNGAAAAQTYTTDSAVNIIAQLSNAINTAYKANVGGFASSLAGSPPTAIPNLFNLSWTLSLQNQGTTAASTLAGGTGVTITSANAGLTSGVGNMALGAPNTPNVTRWVITVTGPASVTFTRVE